MAYYMYLSFDRFTYLSNDEYGPYNHDKAKTTFYFLTKTVCLKVSVSSAKTNILFDWAIIANFCYAKRYQTIFSGEYGK